MQRKFLKNLGFLLVLNLMIKPFWLLGIDRTVQNTVGAADYGFYFAVFNFSFLFNILLDLGITNFNNKNIAQNNHLLTKFLSKIIVIKILLFLLYIVFTIGGALLINYSREQIIILSFLAINQFLISFILYLRSNFGGLHLFVTDSIMSVLDRLLMIIICGVLLWGNVVGEFKIQYFVYAQTIAYGLTAFAGLTVLLRQTASPFLKLKWDWPFFLMILKQSFPYALLVLIMTFYNRIDSVMLERLLPEGETHSGIYASAYRLLDAANNIALLFSVLLLPIFAKMIKQKQSIEELSKLSFTLIIIPALILATGAYHYSSEIMELLYSRHADETIIDYTLRMEASSNVFRVLMCSFIAISSTYVFGTLMTANGSLRLLNIIALSGMILNITLNLTLIPMLQAYGSAISTFFTQFLVAGIQIYLVTKIFRFNINYSLISKLVIFVIGIILINRISLMLPYIWYINFLIMCVAGLLLSFITKLLSIRQILTIIKYGE